MRLKQLLGILISLLLCTVMAAAAVSQLSNVNVTSSGNNATVTIHATGAFTHNEYRPEDKVLLVDLAGVSAASLKDDQKALGLPAVKSYRVLTYKGASGAEVTRLEFTLGENVALKVTDTPGAIELHLSAAGSTAASTASEPATKPEESVAVAAPAPEPKPLYATPVQPKTAAIVPASDLTETSAVIHNVSVVHTHGSTGIEISGVTHANAMKLDDPARIVLDFPGAVSNMHSRTINVNSPEVKSIRIARFQLQPPVTRVVIDLKAPRDFAMSPKGKNLLLTIQPVASSSSSTALMHDAMKPKTAQPVLSASSSPNSTPVPKTDTPDPLAPKAITSQPQKAQDYAFVEPTYMAKADSAAATMAKSDSNLPKFSPENSTALKTGPAKNLALEQMNDTASPKKSAPKYTGEPISVNLKDVDLKDFFRLIHEISGLNVVLDPNVRGSVTLVLDDVPWDQALDIVLQNNGLDRQLQGNVLRIASVDTVRKEAESRRAQVEAQALAVDKQTVTRFLSYAHSKDVVNTVKRFLSARGEVMFDDRTNSLIIQDIPSIIPDIDRLLAQLDRKTQEVEIEARVVAANRTFARDIGMQIGFAWGNGPSTVGGAPVVGQTPTSVTTPVPPPYSVSAGGTIPLFSNNPAASASSGINFTNLGAAYRIDAVLTMAESRGLVKILSRPRVVTQNNVAATVRQGLHVPIVTAAQLGGPPTTSYTDAFLRLTVTPQITVENTIFLAVDVENTTPDFGQTVNGNPTLLTQQATTQVLVTDGGTVVIGGVIQTQNAISTSQTPLLGDIPILGNLFKRRSVTTSTQELIFFISPRIIQT